MCANVVVCLDREEPMAAASCGLQENRAVEKLASLLFLSAPVRGAAWLRALQLTRA